MMFYTMETGRHLLPVGRIYVPKIVQNLQLDIKNHFKRPEYANLIMALFTGQKLGISARTSKDLKKVNLIFLLSPSGFHLGATFLLFQSLLGLIVHQRLKKVFAPLFLLLFAIQAYFLSHQAFIRSLSLRTLARGKFKFKLKINIEMMVVLIFILSFCMGHYHASPLSFIMSFAFLGTFISLKDYGKIHLVLGLFLIQLILNLFLAQKVSLLSIALGLLGVFIFKYLFMLILFYLMTFYIYPSNWIEPFVKFFMLGVRFFAIELRGTFTSSSIFLIFALCVLFFMKHSKSRIFFIAIFFFLHSNTAKAPAITFFF